MFVPTCHPPIPDDPELAMMAEKLGDDDVEVIDDDMSPDAEASPYGSTADENGIESSYDDKPAEPQQPTKKSVFEPDSSQPQGAANQSIESSKTIPGSAKERHRKR